MCNALRPSAEGAAAQPTPALQCTCKAAAPAAALAPAGGSGAASPLQSLLLPSRRSLQLAPPQQVRAGVSWQGQDVLCLVCAMSCLFPALLAAVLQGCSSTHAASLAMPPLPPLPWQSPSQWGLLSCLVVGSSGSKDEQEGWYEDCARLHALQLAPRPASPAGGGAGASPGGSGAASPLQSPLLPSRHSLQLAPPQQVRAGGRRAGRRGACPAWSAPWLKNTPPWGLEGCSHMLPPLTMPPLPHSRRPALGRRAPRGAVCSHT